VCVCVGVSVLDNCAQMNHIRLALSLSLTHFSHSLIFSLSISAVLVMHFHQRKRNLLTYMYFFFAVLYFLFLCNVFRFGRSFINICIKHLRNTTEKLKKKNKLMSCNHLLFFLQIHIKCSDPPAADWPVQVSVLLLFIQRTKLQKHKDTGA